MTTGLLIIVIIGLLGVLSHRRTRLEEKIYKNIPLSDWLLILVFPISFYLGWVMLVRNILDRPRFPIFPLDDIDILSAAVLFMVYGFVGAAIHFTGKILWRYLRGMENTMAYRVNEMFHNRMGHYLTYLGALFVVFLLPVMEINHPLETPVSAYQLMAIIIAGIVFGMAANKSIYYTNEWFGGYNKPLFFIITITMSVLIVLIRTYKLTFVVYPVNLFVLSMCAASVYSFLIRQFFIFSRLGKKRKLRFLAKILSV
jgi:hypothetical protein